MSTSTVKATSLNSVIVTFESPGSANYFFRKEVQGMELWSSSVTPSTAYTIDYNKPQKTIIFSYDQSKNNHVAELAILGSSHVTRGFEDIKAWAEGVGLEFKSADDSRIRFHKP